MNKKISSLEFGILSTYLLKSSILINGINILINSIGNDSIISIILGFLIGFIYIFFFKKLNNKSIFETIDQLPKIISYIIKIILIILTILLSSYYLYTISMFIKSSILNNMDILTIAILFILCVSYIVSKDITTIFKCSFICFFIFILLEVISITFSIPNINSLNILPLFTNSKYQIIKSSFIYSILSISPIFLLLIIPKNMIYKSNEKINNIKLFYIITNIYILFNFTLVLSIISFKFIETINYPEVFVLSKISILDFFDRMEGILSFKLIFDIFFTISISIYYIEEGISSFHNKLKEKKVFNLIIPILILFISNYYQFSNNFIIVISFIFILINIITFLLFYLNNQIKN